MRMAGFVAPPPEQAPSSTSKVIPIASTRGVRMWWFLLILAAGRGIARVPYQRIRAASPVDSGRCRHNGFVASSAAGGRRAAGLAGAQRPRRQPALDERENRVDPDRQRRDEDRPGVDRGPTGFALVEP